MGSDKALLRFAEGTLLERALKVARAAFGEAAICGSRALYGGLGQVVEDIQPGHGPLSGIHAALHATRTPLNVIISVDMPFMEPAFLRWLVGQASSGAQLITAPEALGRLQPLCAVYRQQACQLVDEALSRQQYKVMALFCHTTMRIVDENEIRAAGFAPQIFTNVNTPEEYVAVLQEQAVTLPKGTHE